MPDPRRRSYRPDDLAGLQATVAGWIAESGRCGYDHIGELPHRIHAGRLPFDQVGVWSLGDRTVGITLAGRFGSSFDVLVAPDLRGTPVEATLLTATAAQTSALTTDASVNTDVFDCDTIRQETLTALGFARFRIWDDVRERPLGDEPPPPDPLGFTVRPAGPADAAELARVRTAAFPDAPWTGDAYRAEVMQRPGYDPQREIVAVADDGRVASFAVWWADPLNRLAHLEPVGTDPAFRRRGLATVVLRAALARMAATGHTSVSVNHDATNERAARLYASLGFARVHRTLGFARPRLTG